MLTAFCGMVENYIYTSKCACGRNDCRQNEKLPVWVEQHKLKNK